MDGDNMLSGVQEPFAVVKPGQRAGCRVGIKFHSEIQALAFFNIRVDWTWAS